jgi:hypothetical protein
MGKFQAGKTMPVRTTLARHAALRHLGADGTRRPSRRLVIPARFA